MLPAIVEVRRQHADGGATRAERAASFTSSAAVPLFYRSLSRLMTFVTRATETLERVSEQLAVLAHTCSLLDQVRKRRARATLPDVVSLFVRGVSRSE